MARIPAKYTPGQDEVVGAAGRRRVTGVAQTTWDRMEKAGLAPSRIRLTPSGGRVGWLVSELVAWRESRPRGADPTLAHRWTNRDLVG